MQVAFKYSGRSELVSSRQGSLLSLAPNLNRDPVAFDAALRQPLRFREAISALHDVVVSNLKYQPKDHTAYRDWKANEAERILALRRSVAAESRNRILAQRGVTVAADLEKRYRRFRDRYWSARQKYSNDLRRHDWDLWRKLMPCDPVITVADDVLFFECFSADESSYGCLSVDRDAGFGVSAATQFGTTNVDYSWDLYGHFQSLRSYRETRFRVDPSAFAVATAGQGVHREEKIDLPSSWLRGFLQIQSAMCLPHRTVSLSREAIYSLLAWLKRNKAKTSPRAVRFELLSGRPPEMVLEPLEKRITSWGTTYDGPEGEPIRVWGRNRLLCLARLLPLIERVDVHLLGTGMPSFWVARMGEMRLTLGLSGWTANDWTQVSAVDLLQPPATPSPTLLSALRERLQSSRALDWPALHSLGEPAESAAALNRLAQSGQAIYDLGARCFRWRMILPEALGEAQLGPENPELVASREICDRRRVRLESREVLAEGVVHLTGTAEDRAVELVIDADHRIRRGQCDCPHHRRGGIRMGPCRHLLALRQSSSQGDPVRTTRDWYERLTQFADSLRN